MITDEDPLRGLLFYQDLGFSLTLHVLKLWMVSVLLSSSLHRNDEHSEL